MLEYIAGFFDADGSVSLIRCARNENRSPQVCFHNSYRSILEAIKDYLGCGTITLKRAKKQTHSDSYDLKVTHRQALVVAEKIYPYVRHPAKKERLRLLLEEYLSTTDRQGNYTRKALIAKYDFEERFFQIKLRGPDAYGF